ncbi:hypothetical protein LPJ60_002684 [Coemansia sp. RSA 2675]|nr:hypothetical protein LPJ60_002684 [Coemansia sp. RSA 2675]
MSKSSLGSLPDDVLFGIFSYCNGDDLRELSGVCQSFRAVSQDDYLWKTIYQKRFDRDPPLLGNIFDISFSAETRRRGRISEAQLPRNASLLEFGSDYFDFVLPQPIEITDPFEDVIVQCKCESHEWKTNITLCSVRLVLIEPTTEARARALTKISGPGSERLTEKYGRSVHARRLKNLRSVPGASYRPWRPWSTFAWYEAALIGAFGISIAAVLVQLFLDKTRH